MKVFDNKQDNIFKLLSEAISEGIIIVNKKQEIIASNEAANIMFGYGNDELEGKPLNVLSLVTTIKITGIIFLDL